MEEELNHLLKERRMNGRRKSWRCADELQLAAYVDGALDAKERQSIEAHLADCTSCRQQVSFLARSSDWPEAVEVPPRLIPSAKDLVRKERSVANRFDWRWVTAAAAACLAVGFLFVIAIRLRTAERPPFNQAEAAVPRAEQTPAVKSQPSVNPQKPDAVAYSSSPVVRKPSGPKPESSVPLIRKAEPENRIPRLVAPHDGAVINRGSLTFRWESVADATSYELSIMTASGDVVMSRQTETPSATLAADNQLIPGTKYFVSVRAHLRDGKTARSSVVSFRVIE